MNKFLILSSLVMVGCMANRESVSKNTQDPDRPACRGIGIAQPASTGAFGVFGPPSQTDTCPKEAPAPVDTFVDEYDTGENGNLDQTM